MMDEDPHSGGVSFCVAAFELWLAPLGATAPSRQSEVHSVRHNGKAPDLKGVAENRKRNTARVAEGNANGVAGKLDLS